MPKKILILAGEASGDLQGAFLINSLKKIRNDFEVFGAGGPNLAAAGADIAYDISSLGVVGPWNAVQKLPVMLRMYYDMRKRMVEYRPDLVIMIDSPAMNMRMGKLAREKGFKTVYYFPPSAWCKKRERAEKIASVSSYLIPVFDSQVRTFEEFGIPFRHFGHPLLDIISEKTRDLPDPEFPAGCRIAAFLPGSRPQEINSLMKPYIGAMTIIHEKRKDMFFVIPASSPDMRKLIERHIPASFKAPYRITDGGSYMALKYADAAITASGTATLEASVLGVPMAVVYKLAWPDWILGKMLMMKVPMFALPNLVIQRKAVPEIFQTEVTAERLADELLKIIDDSPERTERIRVLDEVRAALGREGAVQRAAEYINEILSE